jgi:hypothetical protein
MLSTRLSARIMASLCAVSLLGAVACAPQTSVTPGVSNPSTSEQTPATQTVGTELILTEQVNGIENPITPEQIESIEIDGKVINKNEIEITSGDFKTQQADGQDVTATYSIRVNASNIRRAILTLSHQGILSDAEKEKFLNILIKFRSRSGNMREINLMRLAKILSKKAQQTLRVQANEDGSAVGGFANDDGSFEDSEPKFKATKETFEIFTDGQKETFSNTGEGDSESSEAATEEEQAELNVDAISPIALFVGKWRADLLGKSVLADLSDEGNGRIGGTATVDGKSYSASASYTMSAGQPSQLEVVGKNPLGGSLTFQASVEQQNTLTLKLIDANNDPQITPFLNIPVSLKRDL